ncbi:MAG: hypothetical protein JWQ95_1905 [Sphaerisporangium sp.]|nr:hypothetical protein [Sphaerisporangium sp.]
MIAWPPWWGGGWGRGLQVRGGATVRGPLPCRKCLRFPYVWPLLAGALPPLVAPVAARSITYRRDRHDKPRHRP